MNNPDYENLLPLLRKNFLVQWVMFCMAFLTVAGTMSYYLQAEYRNIDNREGERLRTLTRVLDRQIGAELGVVYRLLAGLQNVRTGENDTLDVRSLVGRYKELKNAVPGLQTILMTDPSGKILASDQADLLGRHFSHRDSFEQVRSRADAGLLHVSEPFDPGTGNFAVNLMMMQPGPGGEFDGVVCATLSPDFFSALSPSVLFSPDMWAAIAHGNGLIILIVPHREGIGGMNLAQPGSFFTRHRESGKSENLMTGTVYATGEERMMSLITVKPAQVPMDKPFILAAGRNLGDIRAEWYRDMRVQTVFFLLSAVCIAAGLYRHQIKEWRLRQGMAEVAASLKMSEEFSHSILQMAIDGFVVLDMNGRLRKANRSYCAMSGYSEQELLTMHVNDLEAIDTPDEIATRTLEIAEKKNVRFESRHRRKDGTILDVEVSIQHSQMDGGCLIAFIRDITRDTMATRELETALTKYRTLFDSFPVGVMILDPARNVIETNQEAERILGPTGNETPRRILERLQCKFIRADGTPFPEEEFASARALREQRLVENVEMGIVRPSGETTWINATSAPIPLSNYGAVVLFYDITARRRTEETLKEREEIFSSIVSQAMDAIVLVDTDGKFVEFSNSAHEGLGYTREEFETLGIQDIQAEHSPELINHNMELCRTGEGMIFETKHRHRCGEIRNVRISFKPIQVRGREFFAAVWSDITEQKRSNEELRESKQKFQAMVDYIGIGVALISPDMKILDMNRKMRDWFPDVALETRPLCFQSFNGLSGSRVCSWCPTAKTLEDGQVHESISETPMGINKTTFRVVSSPVLNEQGEVTAAIEMVEDITEKLKLDASLRHAQRMQAIGNLAGGIAHDFNNILFPIVAFAEMLCEDLPEDSPGQESAREILLAGKRGADLVKQILVLSRQKEGKRIPTLLQQVTKEVVKLSRSIIPKEIEITESLQKDCRPVMADATQLHQIGMNLITNAYHAIENCSGKISIQVKETALSAEETSGTPIDPGKYAELTVSDDGIGIPETNLNMIFDPYFTTKPQGKGTGLGLSVVYGIVRKYEGDIRVDSKTGKGTTITVYLPLFCTPEEIPAKSVNVDIRGGSEHILLVDDEPTIADLVRRMLERMGYEVCAQNSSTEALEAFRASPDSYDLVITDMSMPRMNGERLVREMQALRPDIPIILCTGQGLKEPQVKELGIRGFLLKPITRPDLANMVRTVLDESQTVC